MKNLPILFFTSRLGRQLLLAGLVTFVAVSPAWSGEIVYFRYTGATVQNSPGSGAQYLGFNPAAGTFLATDDLFGQIYYGQNGNGLILGGNRLGHDVDFVPSGPYGDLATNPLVNSSGTGGFMNFVSADSTIGSSLDYSGATGLTNLAVGMTSYMPLELQFDNSGDSYYGWAELKRTGTQTYTLLATAYNNQPNQSIQAGAIPEPCTGLLVLAGSVVSLAVRRLRIHKL